MPPATARTETRLTPQLVMGLLIAVVGVLFTLDNMGVADVGDWVGRYWPAGLIVIGLTKLWQRRDDWGGAFGAAMFVLAGTLLLLDANLVIRLDWRDLWPLVLVCIGASMVRRGLHGPRPLPNDTTATISGLAVLGGVKRGNNSPAVRGGDLTAIMGGCEIDLRQASIDGEAVIDVFAMWGGIDIRVPETWTVISRVTPLLGGIDDKTRPPHGVTSQRLVLRGFVIMGGIEVKN